MKKLTILLSMMLLYTALGYSQVAINTDGSNAESCAILDVKSTSKGLLLPRMTSFQISVISVPTAGLLVYNTDSSDFYGYNGSKWISLWNAGDTLADWYCGSPIIDARDGQSYNTVQKGSQCWMSENLNIGTMVNTSSNQTNNGIIEKYCYDNNTTNCDTYGGLYQWDEMMQYVTTEGTQGICPSGWHLPTDAEWKTLEMYTGLTQAEADATGWRGTDEGSKLAGNASLWTYGYLVQNSNFGTSGFTGLPGGFRNISASSYGIASYSNYWASSGSGTNAWYRYMRYSTAQVSRSTLNKNYGFGVRCVRY